MGDAFPLGLYALQTRQQMETEREAGWNLAHTYYQFGPAYVALAASTGYAVLANLPGEEGPLTDEQFVAGIRELAALDAVGWWDFPEERRYWLPAEMQLVRNLAAWTRDHDPSQRPRYMYLPGNYRARDITPYVPYLDVLPASVYTAFNSQPNAWTRWRVEETLAAVRQSGASIGRHYLAGEKTVVAVVGLFDADSGHPPSPDGAYHDFWLSIASGARGVLVSSYAYRDHSPALAASWARLRVAAAQASGPEAVGRAFLFGTEVPGVTSHVTSGPARTPSFRPTASSTEWVSYPSVMVAARQCGEDLYLVVVNSAEAPVEADLDGLPLGVSSVELPFEEATVPVAGGRMALSLPALGVRILVARSAFPPVLDTPPNDAALSVGRPQPNPLRPGRATVAVFIPAGGRVRASVYDTLGRRVATPFDRTLAGGQHRLDLDLSGLASGTYLLRLEGRDASAGRPITILD